MQNWVKGLIQSVFSLTNEDVKSAIMGTNGEDILLSTAARKLFPFSIECKNLARIAAYEYYDQAVKNAKGHIPIVVMKANRKQPLVMIDAEWFIKNWKYNGTTETT